MSGIQFTQKTPISVLNELASKLKIALSGQYIEHVPSPSAVRCSPIFIYEYSCHNYVARAEGTAKKRAQHNAAENMLAILRNSSEFGSHFPRDNISILSPSEIKVEKDAVGPLTDFCGEYSLPLPEYEYVREEGPAHDRRFTNRCFLLSFAVEAIDRIKKQSKQQVALQMLTNLKNAVEPRSNREIISVRTDDFNEVLKKFPNSKTEFNTRNHYKNVSFPFLTSFTNYQNYGSKLAEAFDEFAELEYENPERMLDSILAKTEISYSLLPILAENQDDFIIILHINFVPDLNVCEFGVSYDDASKKAAQKALDYVRILCKPSKKTATDSINHVSSESAVLCDLVEEAAADAINHVSSEPSI